MNMELLNNHHGINLPARLIVDLILPFADRKPWNNLILSNREIYQASQKLEPPCVKFSTDEEPILQESFSSDEKHFFGQTNYRRKHVWHKMIGSYAVLDPNRPHRLERRGRSRHRACHPISSRLFGLQLVCLFLRLLLQSDTVNCFAPTRAAPLRAFLSRSSKTTTTAFQLDATISWSGDASTSLEFSAPTASVQEWLIQSPQDSDMCLLGSTKPMQRDDGNWDCPQPIVEFLGLALLPVFVNGLARDPPTNTVTVTILEARTDIEKYSRANQVVANVMKQSQFTGKSVIRALEGSNQGICQLDIDLSLTIQISLPKFSFLPPGFNMIGNAIVARTGRSRTKQLLEHLRDEYQAWEAKQE
jgi:hypothetical protein